MKNSNDYVCKVTITKIRGCNVLAPSSMYFGDTEIKNFVIDTMESGDEVIIKKMTYEEFLKSLPDKEVEE